MITDNDKNNENTNVDDDDDDDDNNINLEKYTQPYDMIRTLYNLHEEATADANSGRYTPSGQVYTIILYYIYI
jgi:hypothetical protein